MTTAVPLPRSPFPWLCTLTPLPAPSPEHLFPVRDLQDPVCPARGTRPPQPSIPTEGSGSDLPFQKFLIQLVEVAILQPSQTAHCSRQTLLTSPPLRFCWHYSLSLKNLSRQHRATRLCLKAAFPRSLCSCLQVMSWLPPWSPPSVCCVSIPLCLDACPACVDD